MGLPVTGGDMVRAARRQTGELVNNPSTCLRAQQTGRFYEGTRDISLTRDTLVYSGWALEQRMRASMQSLLRFTRANTLPGRPHLTADGPSI